MTKIKIEYLGDLHTKCTHEASGSVIETDAPQDNGGRGDAFSPTDLFATSLGSCILTIMAIAAHKKGIELKGMHAEVEKMMVADPIRRVGKVTVKINAPVSVPPADRILLERAARACPVAASLHPDVQHEIVFMWD